MLISWKNLIFATIYSARQANAQIQIESLEKTLESLKNTVEEFGQFFSAPFDAYSDRVVDVCLGSFAKYVSLFRATDCSQIA